MVKDALIGHTGFVGGVLNGQHSFQACYNSKNIDSIDGQTFALLVCSGIQAAMWLANKNPEEDLRQIDALLGHLRRTTARRFVLISSIAVFAPPVINVFEDTQQPEETVAYGRNRYHAEEVVRALFPEHLIVRLPALFGPGLKKNFIFDLLNREPAFILPSKFEEITSRLRSEDRDILMSCYTLNEKSMFALKTGLPQQAREMLVRVLESVGFTSLVFTHADSRFQFYCLDHLWRDIETALGAGLKTLNLATEPIAAHDIAQRFFGIDFRNTTAQPPYDYDMRTRHAAAFGKQGEYLYSRAEVLADLDTYFARERGKNG